MNSMAGKQVLEFCGLNAKTYSFDNGERKAKGVNKAAKKKYLTHEDYVKILNEQTNKVYKDWFEKVSLNNQKRQKLALLIWIRNG